MEPSRSTASPDPLALEERIHAILATPPSSPEDGRVIGRSRGGREIRAYRFGTGQRRVSLLGGCHADEPVGPRLLRHLCAYLASLPQDDAPLRSYEWWVIPHINPDGAEANARWQSGDPQEYAFTGYLRHVVRELPGDDIEFGFPREPADAGARPENRAAYDWWRSAGGPFSLHVSLHGMSTGGGPWFLIEPAWEYRCDELRRRCTSRVDELGYRPHDVERQGEKGFYRLGPGFCWRPDSRHMWRHFLERGDEETAGRFRPSSMETIRSMGGDPLTLVSEMPLFITPGVGIDIGPPDHAAVQWREWIDDRRVRLHRGDDPGQIASEARRQGLQPMPARDQMTLQWSLIVAGLEQVEMEGSRTGLG